MSDDANDIMESARIATETMLPSELFVDRVLRAIAARQVASGWAPMLSMIERRGLFLTGVAALACVALVAVNLHGLRTLDDLAIRLLLKVSL